MRALSNSIIIIISASLAACGGGGDDGGSSVRDTLAVDAYIRDPLPINAINGQRVAKEVIQGSEAITGGGGPVVVARAPAPAKNSLPELRALTYDLALEQFTPGAPGGCFLIAAARAQNCPGGGTINVNVNDKNHNNQLDVGESGSVKYNNCARDGVVQNGAIALNVIALQGDPGFTSADWAFTFKFRFDDFSTRGGKQGFTLNGGYTLTANYKASTTVYNFVTSSSELRITDGASQTRLVDFEFIESFAGATSRHVSTYSFILDSSNFAGNVTVRTNVPFARVAGLSPETGSLTIRGRDNSRMVVRATGGGTARISIDTNGDGDFTDSQDRVIDGQWIALFS